MSLLAHRGSARRRSHGVVQTFVSTLRTVLGRPTRDITPRARSAQSGVLVGGALVCLLAGYGLGNVFPVTAQPGGLRADAPGQQGTPPTMLDQSENMTPMTNDFLVASAYFDLASVSAAARWLRGTAGIPTARPLPQKTSKGTDAYILAVYFEGDDQREALRKKLQSIQKGPDDLFDHWRKETAGWPREGSVR